MGDFMCAKRLILYSVLVLSVLLLACTCGTNNGNDTTTYTAQNTTNAEMVLEPVECTHAVYKIIIDAECIWNNSVGNDWEHIYLMYGQKITSGYQITVPIGETVETKKITVTIKERDKIPDEVVQDINVEIREGEEQRRELVVTENAGS